MNPALDSRNHLAASLGGGLRGTEMPPLGNVSSASMRQAEGSDKSEE